MLARSLGKKILKITGIFLAILTVLLVGFHFWFQAHAKRMLEQMVESKSKGKLKMSIAKLRFNYFSRKIELEKAVFYNTDTLKGTTAYHFEVDRMQLRARAILPMLFKNQLLIDSLTMIRPHIEVTKLRASLKPDKKEEKKDVSIPEEMGKVYKSIQDALQLLQVKRFQIDDGTFTLINRFDPEQLPLTVSNIDFHIDNLQVDDKLTGNDKILFSDNVVLVSHDQNILFPDGRHRLGFRKFRINLKKKLVEFDSCTITATRSDSTSASFNVFFNALMLTNIDFDTLYKTEVIKADMVYCLNPTFNLDVKIGKKKDVKKNPPKLESIIQQLTGNLLLKKVVVDNASFNIKTMKDGNPSSFTFSNNNFEMQGLSIDQNAKKPIVVKSFVMAIRNYENFIKDSAYSVKFDSVLFKDNRITLSNFLFTKLDNRGRVINTFSIPQFNLLGMSWDDLVFDRKLKADQAILFNPQIDYTASSKPSKKGKQSIFQSLGAVNEYMDLQQIDIIDGTIDLRLKHDLRVRLNDATLSVKSHSLLESKKLAGIKNSLMQLRFKDGIIHAGNLDIELHDILYLGQSGQFTAGTVQVMNKEKSTAISLSEVGVQKMQVDEITGNIAANGIRWAKGNIDINNVIAKQSGGGSSITLTDVQGHNTSFHGTIGTKTASTRLNNVYFSSLIKEPGQKLKLTGLVLNGSSLKVGDDSLQVSVASYDIRDEQASVLRQIDYKTSDSRIRANIHVPSLSLVPHIQPLLNGNLILDGIAMSKPVIDLNMFSKYSGKSTKPVPFPVTINSIRIDEPSIHFTSTKDTGVLIMDWKGSVDKSNFLEINGFKTAADGISINKLGFYLTDFQLTNPAGRNFSTGDGKVSAQIKDARFSPSSEGPIEWSANISNFDARDFKLDSVGKSKGTLALKTGTISNLDISSSAILNLQDLAAANRNFQVKQLTGSFINTKHSLIWSNANYIRNNNTFTADSFSMIPVLSRDSFIAVQTYQTDYTTIKSRAIAIGPINIERFISDKTLMIQKLNVDGLEFTDYKDKKLPFNAGIVKPLAVNMLKQIPLRLSIDSVHFSNARVEYTEVGLKTRQAGVIPVTRMDLKLFTVKNYDMKPGDSLRIHANGYLMDTAWIRLRVKESYTDTLGGFLMTLRMKPADFTILNPALIPLLSAKIESGYLDTLSMRAVGREYLAWGEMKMYYHDLKIRVLKNSDEKKKPFFNSVISFLANSLIIRKKNESRTGNVFFIRNRDRSAINYLIKIAMSGMASSVGAKSNKKMLRKYKRELERRNLPPIDLE